MLIKHFSQYLNIEKQIILYSLYLNTNKIEIKNGISNSVVYFYFSI